MVKNWPPEIVKHLRPRFEAFLRRTYFEVVKRRPVIELQPTTTWIGDYVGCFCTAHFIVSLGDHKGTGRKLDLSWRTDHEPSGAFTFTAVAELQLQKGPIRKISEFTIHDSGLFDELRRQLPPEVDRLDSLMRDLIAVVEDDLPELPHNFEEIQPSDNTGRTGYREMLRSAEHLMSSERCDEAMELLLPVLQSVHPTDENLTKLEFARRASIMLAQMATASAGALRGWQTFFFIKALEYSSALLLKSPKDLAALVDRGMLRDMLWDYEGAVKDCTAALAIDDRLAVVFRRRANLKSRLGEQQSAIEDYTRTIELSGEDESAFYGRAQVFRDLALDDPAHRIEYLRRAVSDFSSSLHRSHPGTPSHDFARRALRTTEQELHKSPS
ncbi:MAG: hypothetical protein HY293_10685 [Planctomycetes bacterium]|nr:hypothetical protein [Planctomycetota bacterium]